MHEVPESTDTPTRLPAAAAHRRGIFWAVLHRPAVWAVLLLFVLPLVFFWPTWWPGGGVRQVFAYGDFSEQYYPFRAFVAGEWRAGRLPLWDPYTYAGSPAAAASLFAAFYPPGLWLALFPHPFPMEALQFEALLHLGLAGAFTFLWLRRLTGRAGAGLVAGVAFSLGGYLTSYPVLQLGILETAAWLPAGLWLVEEGLARRQPWRMALAGLAYACALLAGHPQTFLYIAYISAAYFLLRAWRWRWPLRTALLAVLILAGVTVGASAVQWLPSLELARLSPRAQLSYAEVSNGFSPAELWGLLRPNAGQWSPLYIGWIPLGLAVAGLFRRPGNGAWFWLAAGLAALLLAMGRNGFLYPLFHAVAPGFALFRNQERAALLVSFSLAALAGYGYASLTAIRRPPRWVLPGLLALIFVDLYLAGFGVVLQPSPEGGRFPRTAMVQHLQRTGSADWRTSSEGLLPGDGNAGLVYGLRDVSGNSPLHLADYDLFLAEVPEFRYWQLLNVQHLLTRRQLDHGALAPVLETGEARLYQVFVQAKPAWIVHDYLVGADWPAVLALTADPMLDPFVTAVLEEQPDPAPEPPRGAETAQLVGFAPQHVALDVKLSAPGLVVSSEVAYPGWVVRANGKRVPSTRAYGLLRAVALPAGEWHVEWRYEPLSVRIGLAVSILTLGAVAVGFRRARRSAQRGEHDKI